MTNLEPDIHRWVIPRWLQYKRIIATGELFIPWRPTTIVRSTFAEQFRRFRLEPAPLLASDLLGQAIMEGRDAEAKQLAQYLLKQSSIRPPTRRIAEKTLGILPVIDEGPATEIARSIQVLKRRLSESPQDAVSWIDLARLYTIAGQREKAESAIRIALALAPFDRFCLRAAARYFIHCQRFPDGVEMFRNRKGSLHDPWILATAASMAALANAPSPLPKRPGRDPNNACEAFHNAELFEAFATSELMHGNDKRSRKLFRTAWSNPGVNVITHAEWVTRTQLPGLRGEMPSDIAQSYQALANVRFQGGDFKGALGAIEQWILEEPYSRQPYISASYIHCTNGDFEAALTVYETAKGIRMLSPMLVNNAAFAFLCIGKIEAAELLVAALRKDHAGALDYTLDATEGLLAMKKGDVPKSRLLYSRARKRAAAVNPRVVSRVFLNEMLALAGANQPLDKSELDEVRRLDQIAVQIDERRLVERLKALLAEEAKRRPVERT